MAGSIIHQIAIHIARHWPFHRFSAVIILDAAASQSCRYARGVKRLQTPDLEADTPTSTFIDSLLSSEGKIIQVFQGRRSLVSGTT